MFLMYYLYLFDYQLNKITFLSPHGEKVFLEKLCFVFTFVSEKTLKLFVMKAILFMLLMSLSVNSFAGICLNLENARKDVQLDKGECNDPSKDRPRTLIPILCYYDNGTVYLQLLSNIGELTLTVTDQTTGEQWSNINSLSLDVPTTSGTYLVQIVTEDGTLYYGTYTL